jgi:hypothetical protein
MSQPRGQVFRQITDAAIDSDAQSFRSVVWALERHLPVEQEPHLVEHWEFLYARSIGCIGLLKLHLNRALHLALTESAKTVTLTHLRKTALPEMRVEAALRNALESEMELTESEGADERLLRLLGLRGPKPVPQPDQTSPRTTRAKRGRPGTRDPQRDAIGEAQAGEVPPRSSNVEQAAG